MARPHSVASSRRALITGVNGQDGTILAALLIRQGVEVYGLVRPNSDVRRLVTLVPKVRLAHVDMRDLESLTQIIRLLAPTEIFNLAGVSSISESVKDPQLTMTVNADAVHVMLSALARTRRRFNCRFLQAGSAMVFEGSSVTPQNEQTRPSPITPYACAKAEAMEMVEYARNYWGLHASSAILYNHESPLRDIRFVTRRIVQSLVRVRLGVQDSLAFGSLATQRDWGWAPDYVRGMALMIMHSEPEDLVLATGKQHSLKHFVEVAAAHAGIPNLRVALSGQGASAAAFDPQHLCGSSDKAQKVLGWAHSKTFEELVEAMVRFEISHLGEGVAYWSDFWS